MFQSYFRKKNFRKIHFQLKGAKKLRDRKDPYFVLNTVCDLTDVPLDLEKYDFPKILVGSHSEYAEITLRQVFLLRFKEICTPIIQSIGGGNRVAIPLPFTWVKHLVANGIDCSMTFCRVLLFGFALKKIVFSIIKFLYLAFQIKNPKYPGCSYNVFMGLGENNLPEYEKGKITRDIITWYKESVIKNPKKSKIWAQVKVSNEYAPPEYLIVSLNYFPRLSSFSAYLNFCAVSLFGIIVSIIGVIRGRWWYGLIIDETIKLNYVKNLQRKHLADEYFFNNSQWYYKPLWTYEVENRKSLITQIYYSTNNDNYVYDEYKFNGFPGYQIMQWKRFVVWDKKHENFLKQYCPNSKYIKVGYVDFTGISENFSIGHRFNTLSLFDIDPLRQTGCTKHGMAIPYYLTEELNIKFLQDIKEVCMEFKWIIYWKRKRTNNLTSKKVRQKQSQLVDKNLIEIDPNISASYLVEISDAVISMPFSSPSVIAKFKKVPCSFYDASGILVNSIQSRGIPLLKNKLELREWFKSL